MDIMTAGDIDYPLKLPTVSGPLSQLFHALEAAEGYMVLDMPADAQACLRMLPSEFQYSELTMPCHLRVYQHLGEWASAASVAESLAARFPEDIVWWLEWARSIRHAEGVDAAQWVLSQAARVHPHAPAVLYDLACCTCVLGRIATARRLLGMAISLDPLLEADATSNPDLAAIH